MVDSTDESILLERTADIWCLDYFLTNAFKGTGATVKTVDNYNTLDIIVTYAGVEVTMPLTTQRQVNEIMDNPEGFAAKVEEAIMRARAQ